MTSTATTMRYARIAVERGIDRYPDGLLYGVPAALCTVKLGDYVTVPRFLNNHKSTITPAMRYRASSFDSLSGLRRITARPSE